ncbi:phosphatase PAP2 family protein [Enterococcus villorum]|uniref:Phosphatase PAP2 family protein n=2 Tax=Enterococcus villorum TaxID=112904 RepID=A0A511J537_9ENTE|nr:phosphatase PAP2 family protein [Enterococcus villorum]EOH93473.1 PAP2 family protein [Enterococcus villorum ATCC 700913]EOW75424.1 PAP2 family protein [Enterococcus villorum ATCC 700913]GEL93110.1 phosphatase PAP2 family protein [Enterococcus villorum]
MKQKTTFQVVGSCFFVIFLGLGYIVKYHLSLLSGFDQSLTTLIRTTYPNWNDYQLFMTKFGNPLTVILIFLFVSFLLWWKKKKTELIWFALNFISVAGIINPLIKLLIMRERPTLLHLVSEHSSSFPSGHATTSMILYGTLLVILPVILQKNLLRSLLQLLLAFIIVSVGISRVYLGVHFPSDIIGGYLLSLSWLFFTYPLYKRQKEKAVTIP